MNRDSETMKERSIFDILNEAFAAFGKGFREYVLISLMFQTDLYPGLLSYFTLQLRL